MEFLGVGPFEFVLILMLGLVVLGPERLQGMARSSGRLAAQLMAWQQQSPEAQALQQMRQEFEREIVELRDEFVRARQQVNVAEEVRRLQRDTTSVIKDAVEAGKLTPHQAVPASAASNRNGAVRLPPNVPGEGNRIGGEEAVAYQSPAPSSPLNGSVQLPPSTADADPVGDRLLAELLSQVDEQHPQPTAPPVQASDVGRLAQQVEVLSAQLHALQTQLQERGLLEPKLSREAELYLDRHR